MDSTFVASELGMYFGELGVQPTISKQPMLWPMACPRTFLRTADATQVFKFLANPVDEENSVGLIEIGGE